MEIDLKIYINMIKKRLWIIVLTACIFTFAAALYSNYNYQPIYQASTKLLISNTSNSDPLSSLGQSKGLGGIGVNVTMINTYKEIMRTPAIMEKVVQRHPDLKLTPEQIVLKTNVIAISDTQLMAIVATDLSHERAVRIANYVSEVFQSEVPKIMKIDNIEILNKAKNLDYPIPINQKSSRNIMLAFMASLVISLGIIIVLDALDDTIKTAMDVKTFLEAPTLVMIPKMNQKKSRKNRDNKSLDKTGDKSYATNSQ